MIDYHSLPKERQEELFREWLSHAVGKRVVFKEENFLNPSGSWHCFITEVTDSSTWKKSSYKVFNDVEVETIDCGEYGGRVISLPARGLDLNGWPALAFMVVDREVECEHDFWEYCLNSNWAYYEDWLNGEHQVTCFPVLDDEDLTGEQVEDLIFKSEQELKGL